MPRIKEVNLDDVRDEQTRSIFERDLERHGTVLNTTKVLAHCPEILQQSKQFGQVLREQTRIPDRLHALINALVARRNGCPF